ncbi:GBS Bsp-like repeat-containing protein [Streptococcus parasuis]|uniref:GBS Bsp-like repeat-containing protein n=1 Tax=Streptococcus parasuis TaxID=1501662 RepID=UPI00240E8A7D|nr:GBS Bsp-like repeat-containing protein [Streptococcus parasuis]WFB92799.1 GBS Bsp-like repeat-containing protein [Streptococcus parasuis]
MKKRTLFFLSVCAVALNGYVVHADSLEAPSQLVTVPNLPGTGGQLTVVEEAGQMKAILSNITGEIVGVTGQFKSETNTGKTIAFTIDASGQYVAYLDRTSFSDEDQAFTLALTANLIDGSAHNLDDYSFNWVKVAENTNDDSDLIENTNATEASKPVSSGTVVDSVEKDSSSSASETQSSSTASSSLAATVTDSSNVTSASTLTSTQTTSSVGSQLRSASLMRIAANSSAQSSAVTKASQIDQTLELKYTGSINSGEVIKFAVWSDEKGQDDIVWYNADQTGAAYVDLRKHRDYGKYNIHTYVNRNGKMVYLNEIVVDVKASGTITISNVDSQTGSFDITISNITAPRGLTKVYVPTWTEAGGQDDIKWYEANRESDGSYKLTVNKVNHKSEVGNYQIHVYYRGEDGSMTGIGATTVNLLELKASGTVTAINVNDQAGSYEVKISNVIAPKGLNKVYVPTWTEAGGQDDIVWHEAERQTDGTYLAKITKSAHKNGTGKYISHVYYQSLDGSVTGIGATTVNMPELKASGTVTAINVNDQAGSYEVKISNVVAPKGIRKVFVPTWTEAGGQDDIVWHEAQLQTDGTYLAKISKSEHKNGTGKYISHVYCQSLDGTLTAIGATSITIQELKASGTISISNVDANAGSFDVTISNITAPRGLTKVYVPTWTEAGGQDDIKWHEANRQSDGSYKLTVNKAQHKNEVGNYQVHVYYRGKDGSMTGIGATTVNMPELKASGTVTAINVNDQAGSYEVKISNVVAPRGLYKVFVPTWTETGGQDDIVWHEAQLQSDGTYLAKITKSEHKNGSGIYVSHVYYRMLDGSMLAVGGTQVELPSARSYTIYVDPGHGGVDSGASYGGVYEKNLALSVANKLKANLIQLGYQVLMTRTADYNVDFKTERSKMANQSNADLFISIHFNATGLASSNATGIETYWYQYDPEYQPKINAAMHNDLTRLDESEILANQVQASLISGTGAVNRGVRRDTFAVLRETAIPAILVELGFMDNPSDLQKIKEDAYQTKLANALVQGIDNWYGAVGGKPTSGTYTQKKSTEQSQLTTSEQSFFNNILPAIQQVSQKKGIVTSVMLAQSILESGWGTSQLAKNAYNIFGIKADSSWKGNTYTVHTKEVVNGKTITVEKQFRAYKSLLESISDYGSFFTSTAWRTKNYASFLQATNHETALTSLLASGYATDPVYAEKLKSLIQRYGLDQYDLN